VIAFRAEKPDLLHGLGADAAGRDVGDAAGGKRQADVGDVDLVRKNGNADRLHAGDRRIHEFQDQVQVMNHQIQNDVHVGAALEKGMQTMHFNKGGPGDHLLEGHHGGIEPLDESDLQNQAVFPRQCQKLVGLLKRRAQRLFDERVNAGGQEIPGDGKMISRRHGDADRVHAIQHVPVVRKGRTPVKIGCLLRLFDLAVGHGGNDAGSDPGVFLKMITAQMADPDHADA